MIIASHCLFRMAQSLIRISNAPEKVDEKDYAFSFTPPDLIGFPMKSQ